MPYNICVERMSKKWPLKSKQLSGTTYAMRSAGGVAGRQQAAFKEWSPKMTSNQIVTI
jgi:hypothetical protein